MSSRARAQGTLAALHRRVRRLSLRSRLVVGLIAVVVVGLVVADFVIYQQIRSYLGAQIDQELLSIQPGNFLVNADGTIELRPDQLVPPGTYIKVVLPNGQVVGTNVPGLDLHVPATLEDSVLADAANGTPPDGNPIFTANATGSALTSGGYRVRTEMYFVSTGVGLREPAVAFVALPLSSFSGTLNQLVLVDIAVTAAVVAALVLLAYFVVRVGMRPLADIERTAESIAGGDLSQRIEQDDPKTEVGRLGASLNKMLGRIEDSFAQQQASEDRLRQFLADASHELRTPLTSIRGYSELFRRGAQNRPEDLTRAMRRIEDESVRMGVLVDDLLLLARLDQGRAFEPQSVDLAEVATDAAADAQVVAPDREVTVDANLPVIVRGDEQRLRQLVMNLLQNALVHTPAGTPIEVGVRSVGSVARIEVTDHGEGIAPEHAERIFERFYRADASRARESGGSGLGLSIVASIAEAHGGTVRVDRPPSGGARFLVELPLETDEFETGSQAGTAPFDRDRADRPGDVVSSEAPGGRPASPSHDTAEVTPTPS